ncbi:DUF1654 domain-containing protein [Pseudomonas sp. RW10S2]|uniref:DUF1654 domain-containing protein n=1 Tax=Pseudomonas sp. RW10S2 TaxID=459637 RepID=UPI00164588B1|nr:DUF1654 domain-containing protein [Pseudomonas sp. RW10S2]MBC3465031.1 DUF1654 domain-containing protein [Pseudomonas sp. RW10S2]
MAAVLQEISLPVREELSGIERLGLRVSAMINSPIAQLGRRVLIHRLDTDSDQDWDAIMELLSETEGLDMTFCDDGSVILQWAKPEDEQVSVRTQNEEEIGGDTIEEQPPF